LASEKKSADAFEAALKRQLQSAPSSNAAECPAPDLLAAYYDRVLSRRDRARVDSHLISCARCQSMMASIARADDVDRSPVDSEPARGFFWITRLLAPMAMVGIAIAIAIGVRTREQRAPEVIALASPAVAPKLEAAEPAAAPPPEVASQVPSVPPAPAGVSESRTAKIFAHYGKRATEKSVAPSLGNAAVARGIEESPEAARSERRELAEEKSASAAIGNSNLSAAAPASAAAQNASAALAGEVRAPTAAMGSSLSGATTMMAKAPRINQISSPYGSVAWQFGIGGAILRSANSGAWVAQHSGVTTDLLAASAPSHDVCWMVGKSGTIVRTLDSGAHWQLITPPSHANFTAISATDSNNAIVIAANGQRFATHDGGVTWSPQ